MESKIHREQFSTASVAKCVRRLFAPLLVLVIGVMFYGCSKQETIAPDKDVLAQVNDRRITADEFQYWCQRNRASSDGPEARQELLQHIIERAALVEQARSAGLDQDPELRRAIDSLIIARLKEVSREQTELKHLNDDALRAYYDEVKEERFSKPAQTQVAVLWFQTRGRPELVERYQPVLEKARAEIIADDSLAAEDGFGLWSMTYSEHAPTRFKGGVIGWLRQDASYDGMRKAVLDVANTLETPGQISSVVTTPDGIFLVRLMDQKDQRFAPFESVADLLAREWKTHQRKAQEAALLNEALASSKIQIWETHLMNVPMPEDTLRGTMQPLPLLSTKSSTFETPVSQ
ncbi:peptidylprolyl isomerase [Rubellicoccus peritrichatus]|uniref:Peptidyl-prolyl cis-trans isomerase n=1 Tax=Rubellicoccus peritrichatus TaxID=3080537 RepID=A0AAQ3L8X2_9BACT|nr:peptidyl-prolyl cis-trans isomerase [Puniceicoccus sp. CR14]WOO41006.1 peptidyl-prolyl cis-trans isomerase [Puniceicoccus sp. CR14]